MPLRPKSFYILDEESKALWDRRQRCLLYVAATRARDKLAVTGSGALSPFLTPMMNLEIEVQEPKVEESATKSCPRCGTKGNIAELFGYRRIKRQRKDGTEMVVAAPQSYCMSCRGQRG